MQFDSVNVNDYPDAGKAPLVPVGTYKMQATEAEVKPTSTGTGQYIKITWTIMEGAYAKRNVYTMINTRNVNQEAERIGRSQLASVMLAIGLQVCNDTDQLLYKPLMGKVGIDHDKTGQYDDKNKIISYSSCTKNGPEMPAQSSQPSSAPAVPPWKAQHA